MIRLTRLSGSELYLNADLICSVEAHPDTVVTLIDGKHYVVVEPVGDVVEAVMQYRANILAGADSLADSLQARAATPSAAAPGHLYVVDGERD